MPHPERKAKLEEFDAAEEIRNLLSKIRSRDILDELFEDFDAALRRVRGAEIRTLRRTLRPGDRATLHNTKPQYLNGLEVEVVEVNRTRAKVQIVEADQKKGRRFSHGVMNTPLVCLNPSS